MPQYLCLWNLSRQTHRELRNFCIPELEAALLVFQGSPPQVQTWPGTDSCTSQAEPGQAGKPISALSLIDSLPVNDGKNTVSAKTNIADCQPLPEGRAAQGNWLLHTAHFEDDAVAEKVLQRCVLLKAIVEVWGLHNSFTDVANGQACDGLQDARIFNLSTGPQQARKPGAEVIAALKPRGPARQSSNGTGGLAAAKQCCVLLPEGGVLLGRVVSDKSNYKLLKDATGTKSPTCMRPEAALVSANLAKISKGSVVLDPCAGSCSLLRAAQIAGASYTMACDISADYFPLSDSPENTQSECATVDIRCSHLRRGIIDAIITDPPYGRRASFGTTGSHNASTKEEFQDVLEALFSMAGAVLRDGGALVTWLPFTHEWLGSAADGLSTVEALQHWLQARGAGHGLQIKELIAEERPGAACRAVAVFQKGLPGDPRDSDSAACRALQPAHVGVLQKLPPRSPDDGSKEADDNLHRLRDRAYGVSRSAQTGLNTDIWRAAWNGDTEAICAYLGEGGCPNRVDLQGRAPLAFAAGYGRAAAAKLLLDAGADAAAPDGCASPLHRAASRGHATVAELLLQSGADVAARDVSGCSALHLACRFGHAAAARVLIAAAGAQGCRERVADALDGAGSTCLHSAAQWGHTEVASVLLKEGHADAAILTHPEGLTALHLAARWGHVPMLKLLAAHLQPEQAAPVLEPAAASCGVSDQAIPLRTASGELRRLLAVRSSKGITVMDEARMWGRQRCCEYLATLLREL